MGLVWKLHQIRAAELAIRCLGPHDQDIFDKGFFVKDIKAAYGMDAKAASLYRQKVIDCVWRVYKESGYELNLVGQYIALNKQAIVVV